MEHSAFERFFVEHHDGLYRLMYRLVGTQQEAEDLVQEAFLKLYHHHEEIQRGKHKPWLYQVAMNLGRNVIRQRKSVQAGQQALQTQPTEASRSGDLVEAEHVRATLQQMPARQQALLLYYTAGLSRQEIAAMLELSPASIGQLLRRARSTFQALYEGRS